MKEDIEKITFKYKLTIKVFFFFLILTFLCPLSGDDWKSYLIGMDGLGACFNNIDFSKGILGGFLINFFSYNKLLFDIFFALTIANFVKMTNDLVGKAKTKNMFLYPFVFILSVSAFTFSYNYMSVTGTVAYTIPIIFIFLFFYILLKDEEIHAGDFIQLLLLGAYICLSSIHIALAFFITSLIYFIFSNRRKSNYKYFIISAVELIFLVISLTQIKSNIFYTNANFLLDNISNYIRGVFSENILLILVGAVPINMYLFEKLKSDNYKRVVITLFDLILIFSLSYNFFNYSPVNLNLILSKYNGIFATENWYYIFFFITYIALFICSTNHYISNRKLKLTFNSLLILSILLSIISVISPSFDKGNYLFIIFTIIMITCVLFKYMNAKVYVKIVRAATFVLVIYYGAMLGITKYVDMTRTDYIKEQIESKESVIEVKANPLYLVWRYNPVDYFQKKDFKKFHKIDDNKEIEVKYFGLFEKIEKRIKE